jgi:hypothetical protein
MWALLLLLQARESIDLARAAMADCPGARELQQ